MSARTLVTASVLMLIVVSSPPCVGQSPARDDAGKVGFDPERLARVHAMVKQHIDDNKHAGAVTLIARKG
jgi:hypothetical protein